MILIIGLGNPGKQYKNTPHNVGFETIDLFKERFDFPDFILDKNTESEISEKDNIVLVKPQTFMNNSGIAVNKLFKKYKITDKDSVFIIQDENKLNIGEIAVTNDKEDNGHNGIKSIKAHQGSFDFTKFKIGTNHPGIKNLIDFVLTPFLEKNQIIINEAIEDVLIALEESINIWN